LGRRKVFFCGEVADVTNPVLSFAGLPDSCRETKNKRFARYEMLTMALCAVDSGRGDWKSVADFGSDGQDRQNPAGTIRRSRSEDHKQVLSESTLNKI
jgi:hypothetical protein